MEKSVPDFSERHGDGGRALLMPPEPNPETFPALERPQGEERRAAFLQDAKKPPENPALSGTETELEEDAFYGVEELAAMSREGKGPELREDPDFFSSLARQEPDVALEAHDEAGESRRAPAGWERLRARPRRLGRFGRSSSWWHQDGLWWGLGVLVMVLGLHIGVDSW